MRKLFVFGLIFSAIGCAEVRTLSLREAVQLALKQNSDIVLARLDEAKAVQSVRIAKDPFSPKIVVGSGLAYSSGFPLSIEGSAPSIFQAQALASIFNRPQTYQVAQARENIRTAQLSTSAKQEEVAFRTASLWLDARHAALLLKLAGQQVESLEKVEQVVKRRVEEGRALPIEDKRAGLRVSEARHAALVVEGDLAYAESSLAAALGFAADDRVVAAESEPIPAGVLPHSAGESVQQALQSSLEIRRLESAILANSFEIRAYKAERLPKIDLVAQYALLGRFNNYDDFFSKFQRHNGELGISFQIPLYAGTGSRAGATRATLEETRLRTQLNAARSKISLDAERNFQDLEQAQSSRELAHQSLELAREELSLLLAQTEEGRASLAQVEQARVTETARWVAYYDAEYTLEKTRFALLRHTGTLLAALQ